MTRSLSLTVAIACLACVCMGMASCPQRERVAAEQPRATAIAESTMPADQAQLILAGAAMKLRPVGRLRFAHPDMLDMVVRPPTSADGLDFVYSLYFDRHEGVYWLCEKMDKSHGPRWYGPIMPDNPAIEALTPEDYVPPKK